MNRPLVTSLIVTFLIGITFLVYNKTRKPIQITIIMPQEEKIEFTNGVPATIRVEIPKEIPKGSSLIISAREAHGKQEEIMRIDNVMPGATISEEWTPDLHGEEDQDEPRYWFITQLVDNNNHPLADISESDRFYLYEQ